MWDDSWNAPEDGTTRLGRSRHELVGDDPVSIGHTRPDSVVPVCSVLWGSSELRHLVQTEHGVVRMVPMGAADAIPEKLFVETVGLT